MNNDTHTNFSNSAEAKIIENYDNQVDKHKYYVEAFVERAVKKDMDDLMDKVKGDPENLVKYQDIKLNKQFTKF